MAIDGGPAVRGNKLLAWRIPPIVKLLNGNKTLQGKDDDTVSLNLLAPPADSEVIPAQRLLLDSALKTLRAVSRDVGGGLRETVGIKAELVVTDRAAVKLELPPCAVEPERIAHAIDLENVEAWCDEHRAVYVGISPWYSTKDVDQTVLAITKVVHVLLGLHADDTASTSPDKRFKFLHRLTRSMLEIANLQRDLPRE